MCHLCLLATRERRWHTAAAASRDGGVVDYNSSTRSGSWGWKDESLQQLWGDDLFVGFQPKLKGFEWDFVFHVLFFFLCDCAFLLFLFVCFCLLRSESWSIWDVCVLQYLEDFIGHSNPSKSERQVKIQPFSQQVKKQDSWDVQHLSLGSTDIST